MAALLNRTEKPARRQRKRAPVAISDAKEDRAANPTVWRITLPFPPALNTLFPTGKDGKRHKSARYKAYCEECSKILQIAKFSKESPSEPIDVEFGVRLNYYEPRVWCPDLDNLKKAVMDNLEGIYFTNDKNCKMDHSDMHRYDGNPRVECEVFEMDR